MFITSMGGGSDTGDVTGTAKTYKVKKTGKRKTQSETLTVKGWGGRRGTSKNAGEQRALVYWRKNAQR